MSLEKTPINSGAKERDANHEHPAKEQMRVNKEVSNINPGD